MKPPHDLKEIIFSEENITSMAEKIQKTILKSEEFSKQVNNIIAKKVNAAAEQTKKNYTQSGLGKLIVIDILYFLLIECTGAFTFLNEFRIWPCLDFFFGAIRYSIFDSFGPVTSSHFSKFKSSLCLYLVFF